MNIRKPLTFSSLTEHNWTVRAEKVLLLVKNSEKGIQVTCGNMDCILYHYIRLNPIVFSRDEAIVYFYTSISQKSKFDYEVKTAYSEQPFIIWSDKFFIKYLQSKRCKRIIISTHYQI